MPFWSGFSGGASHESAAPDAGFEVVFAPEGRDTAPLAADEIKSVEWLQQNYATQSAPLLDRLLQEYPGLRLEYGYDEEELEEWMPNVRSTEEFKSLISLQSVTVHQLSKDGVPYAGYMFDTLWDPEHGLGVLMHGTRVVAFGGADTAILLWLAEQDANRSA